MARDKQADAQSNNNKPQGKKAESKPASAAEGAKNKGTSQKGKVDPMKKE